MFKHVVETDRKGAAVSLLALRRSRQKSSNLQTPDVFSRTVIVTLQNDEEVVVQFRPESLYLEPFEVARKVFDAAVPDSKAIQDEKLKHEGIRVYWMTCIPEET